MTLRAYESKRNFQDTPEPQGIVKRRGSRIFVVQRHRASHLHYDFRLEVNGVLKSWAIPKGPSMNPGDKRLAVMVEDHPLEYATFEGDIPEGNYGAGHVDIWDHGTFEPVDEKGAFMNDDSVEQKLEEGHLKFLLHGKLLRGEFALVHFKKDEKSWLLIKHKDEYATDDHYDSEDYVR